MDRMPTTEQVTEALRSVIDPELRRDIVELEMVRSIDVHANGVVDVMVSLTTPGCPIRSHFETGVATAIRGLDGVTGVNVTFDVLSGDEKSALGRKLGRGGLPEGAHRTAVTAHLGLGEDHTDIHPASLPRAVCPAPLSRH